MSQFHAVQLLVMVAVFLLLVAVDTATELVQVAPDTVVLVR